MLGRPRPPASSSAVGASLHCDISRRKRKRGLAHHTEGRERGGHGPRSPDQQDGGAGGRGRGERRAPRDGRLPGLLAGARGASDRLLCRLRALSHTDFTFHTKNRLFKKERKEDVGQVLRDLLLQLRMLHAVPSPHPVSPRRLCPGRAGRTERWCASAGTTQASGRSPTAGTGPPAAGAFTESGLARTSLGRWRRVRGGYTHKLYPASPEH